MHEDLAAANRGESVPDVRASIAQRFDFRSREDHARLVGILDKIIMGSLFVLGEHFPVCFFTHDNHSLNRLMRRKTSDLYCIKTP
ncbi:hypothetical protein D3C75_441840 [compost metagenome]